MPAIEDLVHDAKMNSLFGNMLYTQEDVDSINDLWSAKGFSRTLAPCGFAGTSDFPISSCAVKIGAKSILLVDNLPVYYTRAWYDGHYQTEDGTWDSVKHVEYYSPMTLSDEQLLKWLSSSDLRDED